MIRTREQIAIAFVVLYLIFTGSYCFGNYNNCYSEWTHSEMSTKTEARKKKITTF